MFHTFFLNIISGLLDVARSVFPCKFVQRVCSLNGLRSVEDVQGFALLDTCATRTVGVYTMVQHAPTWMESAEPAVNVLNFAEVKKHNLGRRCGFRCQEQTQNERSDPELFWTRHDPGVRFRDRCHALTVSRRSSSASNPYGGDVF